MIEYRLGPAASIVYIRPTSALEQEDFANLARAADPHIEATSGLAGLVIELAASPGWDWAPWREHFRFVRDAHKRVRKVAVVTNSVLGSRRSVSPPTSWRRRSSSSRPARPSKRSDGFSV